MNRNDAERLLRDRWARTKETFGDQIIDAWADVLAPYRYDEATTAIRNLLRAGATRIALGDIAAALRARHPQVLDTSSHEVEPEDPSLFVTAQRAAEWQTFIAALRPRWQIANAVRDPAQRRQAYAALDREIDAFTRGRPNEEF